MHSDKGQALHQPVQSLSSHASLARTKQYRHNTNLPAAAAKNTHHQNINFLRVSSDGRITLLPADSIILTPRDLQRLQRSYQPVTTTHSVSTRTHPRYTSQQPAGHYTPSPPSQLKGRAPPIVKTTTLAAARRLAQVCLDQEHPTSRHKALLFSGVKPHSANKLGPAAPIVSRHLKQRKARADSYSSSSSDSTEGSTTNHSKNKFAMARDLRTMYDIAHGGVSRITEDLANSLYIEKAPIIKPEYITSPSAESTYSNHSLFSERSNASNFTNNSSQASDAGHGLKRTSSAHPSAARILSLHHHSPETQTNTPRKAHQLPEPASHGRLIQQVRSAYLPLDDPRSRYFARRNAIAPMADTEGRRSAASSFGPMRTSRPLKTGRTTLPVSHVSGSSLLYQSQVSRS